MGGHSTCLQPDTKHKTTKPSSSKHLGLGGERRQAEGHGRLGGCAGAGRCKGRGMKAHLAGHYLSLSPVDNRITQ